MLREGKFLVHGHIQNMHRSGDRSIPKVQLQFRQSNNYGMHMVRLTGFNQNLHRGSWVMSKHKAPCRWLLSKINLVNQDSTRACSWTISKHETPTTQWWQEHSSGDWWQYWKWHVPVVLHEQCFSFTNLKLNSIFQNQSKCLKLYQNKGLKPLKTKKKNEHLKMSVNSTSGANAGHASILSFRYFKLSADQQTH